MARRRKQETENLKITAKNLFFDSESKFTIREIAERVGVTEKTLRSWITKERWKKLKISIATSKTEALGDFYKELEALNTSIKNGNGFADSKQAQQRRQLIKDIKAFETETSIAEIYEVGRKFLDFLKPQNEELFKKVLPYYDAFLRDNVKQ